MNEEQIFSEIRAALPALVGQEKRMRHILGVEQEAKALSELFCEAGLLQKGEAKKLRLAALVHDITKTKTTEEQLQLCREYGIATDARLQNSSKLLHAYTGGPYAAQRFGTEWIDGDVQRAVRYHTTGRAGMDLLEKLLFLADYIEPGRTWPACVTLRAEFWCPGIEQFDKEALAKHLDRVLIHALDQTLFELLREKQLIDPDTVSARNALLLPQKQSQEENDTKTVEKENA